MHALEFESSRSSIVKGALEGFMASKSRAMGVDRGWNKLTGDEWNSGKGLQDGVEDLVKLELVLLA